MKIQNNAQDDALLPDSYRLAYSDQEFLLRRETRGIRIQLELLKPDLEQQAHGIENTIVVFGSARFPSPEAARAHMAQAQTQADPSAIAQAERDLRNSHHYEQARLFGRLVAEHSNRLPPAERMYICTGGGPGIMEAANRGAFEMGAVSVGLNITLPHEQHHNPYIEPSLNFKFHYFALRKMHFMMRAKALVAFPGGFGTLDELFEILTLVQTGKSLRVPIVLFGSAYWKALINFDFMLAEGVISKQDLELFRFVDDAPSAWEVIETFYRSAASS
jgi:uncharacterized protein (TIGR00730 family)